MSQSTASSVELFPSAGQAMQEVYDLTTDVKSEPSKALTLVSHTTLLQMHKRVELLEKTIDNHIKTCVCPRLHREPSFSPEAPDEENRPYLIVQTFSETTPAYWYIPYHLHDKYLENLLEDHDTGHLTIKRRDALFLHLRLCGLKGHPRMPKGIRGPHKIYYIHCSVNE